MKNKKDKISLATQKKWHDYLFDQWLLIKEMTSEEREEIYDKFEKEAILELERQILQEERITHQHQGKSWKEIWESYSPNNRLVLLAAFGFIKEDIDQLANASWEGVDQCIKNRIDGRKSFISKEADSMFEQDIENSYEEGDEDER